MQKEIKILSIVVTYNAASWLDICLKSLQQSKFQTDIFVVDNASSDDTISLIKKNYPTVTLIQQKENLGFGKANNIGFKYALKHNYDYTFLLNQDAAILPDTLQSLITCQQNHSNYGIISPMQFFKKNQLDKYFESYLVKHLTLNEIKEITETVHLGAHIPSNHPSPRIKFGAGSKGELTHKTPLNEESQIKLKENAISKDIYSIPYVNAAIWLISQACLHKTKGFDPDFEHYGEDDEFLQRTLFFNFKIGICPKATGFHYRKQETISNQNLHGIALEKYVQRHALVLIKDLKISHLRAVFNSLFFYFKYILKSFRKLRYKDGFILIKSLIKFKFNLLYYIGKRNRHNQ